MCVSLAYVARVAEGSPPNSRHTHRRGSRAASHPQAWHRVPCLATAVVAPRGRDRCRDRGRARDSGTTPWCLIDTVSEDATGRCKWSIARACSTFRSSMCTSGRSNSSRWRVACANGFPKATRTWQISSVVPPSRYRKTSRRAAAGQRGLTRPNTTRSQEAQRWSPLRTSTSCE